MEDEGWQGIPCAKTFNNIFHRHGLIERQGSLAAKPHQRFEKGEPNEMWQADFTRFLNYGGQGYYLSEGFRGKTIAVRRSHLPGQITLVFRQFKIGRIDVENRVYTLRKIYRLENDPREKV